MQRQLLKPEQANAIVSAIPGQEYGRSIFAQKNLPPSILVLSKEAEDALVQAVETHGRATVHRPLGGECIILSHRRRKRLKGWREEGVYLEYPERITPKMEREIIATCQRKAGQSFLSYCLGSHEYLSLLYILLLIGAWWLHSLYTAVLLVGLASLIATVLYVGYSDKRRMLRQTLRALDAGLPMDENSYGLEI